MFDYDHVNIAYGTLRGFIAPDEEGIYRPARDDDEPEDEPVYRPQPAPQEEWEPEPEPAPKPVKTRIRKGGYTPKH